MDQTGPVLADWVVELPWKIQTVLLTGTRGADTHVSEQGRLTKRWMRTLVCKRADPGPLYMAESERDWPEPEKLMDDFEFYPVHYFAHAMHCFQIIGNFHPDPVIKDRAAQCYVALVDGLHLHTESRTELINRLRSIPTEES